MRMRIFFIMLLTVINVEAIAQNNPELESQRLNMKAIQAYHNGYYQEGISFAQKAYDCFCVRFPPARFEFQPCGGKRFERRDWP